VGRFGQAVYLWRVRAPHTMQKIVFAIGHFLESMLSILVWMGWFPVTVVSLLMGFGLVYWLMLQGRYNRKAKQDGTLA
jgi:hypothetical protein